jgi:hypothetical protein
MRIQHVTKGVALAVLAGIINGGFTPASMAMDDKETSSGCWSCFCCKKSNSVGHEPLLRERAQEPKYAPPPIQVMTPGVQKQISERTKIILREDNNCSRAILKAINEVQDPDASFDVPVVMDDMCKLVITIKGAVTSTVVSF